MAVTGQRLPADPHPFSGIYIFPIAEEMCILPPTKGTPLGNKLQVKVDMGVKQFTYFLYPNCRQMDPPLVTYYLAFNNDVHRVDYVVGPNDVDQFGEHPFVYANGAYNFFGFLGNPSRYELRSSAVGYYFLNGQYSAGFRMLGSAWVAALQDPNWWVQAIPATEGLARPTAPKGGLARGAGAAERGVRAPAVSEGTPPVRGGAAPASPVREPPGKAPLAQVERETPQPKAFLSELDEAHARSPRGEPADVAPRLARGNLGERLAADALHADGHTIMSYKPEIAGTNQGGFDMITLKDNKVFFVDNKALTRSGNVSSVSSLTTNFEQNLVAARSELASAAADASRPLAERQLFQQAVDATESGRIVKAVTNANVAPDTRILSGITDKLKQQALEFIDVMRKR